MIEVANDDEGGDDEVEATPLDSSEILNLGPLMEKKGATSHLWKFFLVYTNNKYLANCKICKANVKLGNPDKKNSSISTSKLFQHLDHNHRDMTDACELEEEKGNLQAKLANVGANKRQCVDLTTTRPRPVQTNLNFPSQTSLNFPEKLATWIVDTYQPLSITERESFRDMVRSLNPKAMIVSRTKVVDIIRKRATQIKACLMTIISKQAVHGFCITTDGWTSVANQSFTALTVHWIDTSSPGVWSLRKATFGCFPKTGRSRAEDHIQDIEVAVYLN